LTHSSQKKNQILCTKGGEGWTCCGCELT